VSLTSLTIDHGTPQVTEITGLSMAAHAQAVIDPAEASKALPEMMCATHRGGKTRLSIIAFAWQKSTK
jgi:hypothetical protein